VNHLRLRAVFVAIGIITLVLVILSPVLNLSQPGIGVGKLTVMILAILLIAVGIFWRNLPRAYSSLALILMNIVVLLVFVEVGLGWLNRALPDNVDQKSESPQLAENGFPYDPRSDLSVYQDVDWGAQYWEDYARTQFSEYTPYTLWHRRSYSTETINIDGDIRLTTPNDCTSDSLTVFAFGGSTMWGSGAPDWATIPSYLQPLLSDQMSQPICISNFGQPSWITNQNLIQLVKQLQQGNIPDMVIFYDGYNDTRLAFSLGIAGLHYQYDSFESIFRRATTKQADTGDLLREFLSNTQTYKFLSRFTVNQQVVVEDFEFDPDFEPYTDDEMMRLSSDVVGNYLKVYDVVQALGRSYGFDVYFFWQPQAVTSTKELNAEEQERLDNAKTFYHPQLFEFISRVDQEVSIIAGEYPNLFDISDVFDDVGQDQFVWLDLVHVTYIGNEFIADRMMDELSQTGS
jgi:hypothetical protein